MMDMITAGMIMKADTAMVPVRFLTLQEELFPAMDAGDTVVTKHNFLPGNHSGRKFIPVGNDSKSCWHDPDECCEGQIPCGFVALQI